ncbi:MAG: Cytochrome c biogenesis protein transmembrane region [Parcubacteria group bacterium GW2011_GWA2_47_8]|nr:MAG: Cytochrome c biogenesis protein transmembrane region [Parcubacteria group bacterium GW2011_GWA2_47_8]OHB20545.1 MAG: hypothetical protein A2666_03725 [Parcubacteria group bacterium RIFCSPHIGHO2_01_FULL_47_10b]
MDIDVILTASIIASFIAGMVALFAPCCITVLLPAYLGSVFKERRRILAMTVVFFLGIAVIIIPIGMGAVGLAQLFSDFHRELYVLGGSFMVVLGVMTFLGKSLPLMPFQKSLHMPVAAGTVDAKSVFVLGLFSGAATSCCAPVLAGAVTLAALSGTFWKALVVSFAYVFGMTFPLFILAYFYDRLGLQNMNVFKGKELTFRLGATKKRVSITSLLASIIFVVIGATLVTLALSNNAFWSPTMQAELGMSLNVWSTGLVASLGGVPEVVWGVLIIGLFVALVRTALYNNNKNKNKPK